MSYYRYSVFLGLMFFVLCSFSIFANGSKENGNENNKLTEKSSSLPSKAEYAGTSPQADFPKEKSSETKLRLNSDLRAKVSLAEAALAQEELFEAIQHYLDAAYLLAMNQEDSDLPEFDNYLKKAEALLANLSLELITAPKSAKIGTSDQIEIQVAIKNKVSGKVLQKGQIIAEFSDDSQDESGIATARLSFQAQEQGLILAAFPAVKTTGPKNYRFSLDFSSYFGLVSDLKSVWREKTSAFIAAQETVSLAVSVLVESAAQIIPTAFIVQELNARGNPSGLSSGGQALTQEWKKAGYKLASVLVGPNFLLGKEPREVESLLKMVSSGRADRIGIGTFRLLSGDTKVAEGILVHAEGTVSVYDVATGKILLQVKNTAEGLGKTASAANAAAFANLGTKLGEELLRLLP